MRRVTWGAGLFRLWIVVSTIWLAVFLTMATASIERPHPLAAVPGKTANYFDKFDRQPSQADVSYAKEWHLNQFWQLVAAGTVPPLVLLGLGLAGFWVARGFRYREEASQPQ